MSTNSRSFEGIARPEPDSTKVENSADTQTAEGEMKRSEGELFKRLDSYRPYAGTTPEEAEAFAEEGRKLQSDIAEMARLIQEGDLNAANRLSEKHVTWETTETVLKDLIHARVEQLVASGDTEAMQRFAEMSDVKEITPDNLSLFPEDIIQSEAVQSNIRKAIENDFFANVPVGLTHTRENSIQVTLHEYETKGLLTPEAARKIVSAPRFQQAIESDVREQYEAMTADSENNPRPKERIENVLRAYAETGLLTREKSAEILASL